MSLTSPVIFAGVQSVDFIAKNTGLPLGRVRVVQSAEFQNEIPLTELFGGAQKSSWGSIEGASAAKLNLVLSEYPEWLVEIATGGTKTSRAAEATGGISSLTNSVGTTVGSGVVVTRTVGDYADLKTGRYFMKATGAKALTVYSAGSNLSSASFTDDSLAIFTVDLSASPVVNAAYGLTFTDNASAFTTSDVAFFDVRAINTDSYSLKIGSETSTLNNVQIIVAGQLTSGQQVVLNCYNCKAGGLPLNFAPNTFSELSLSFTAQYCGSLDGIAEINYINLGTSGTC